MTRARRGPLIVAGVIVLVLLACAATSLLGVVWLVSMIEIDIPYPDGPPPSPSVQP